MTFSFERSRGTRYSTTGRSAGHAVKRHGKGIIDLANEKMAQALRVISIQRGFDPADFTLTCFGGAGGLHLCSLAQSLGMSAQ